MIYATLGFFTVKAHPHRPYPVFMFCLVYGLSDEIHQTFIPLRQFELLDLLADALGSACAIAASEIIIRRSQRPSDT
jgi:VanZ family protein